MKEERIEILKMLHEGIISVEEAEKLLSALNAGEDNNRHTHHHGKHQNQSYDGNFFGTGFFKELDKGLSGIGKMFDGAFGNFKDFHPYNKNDENYGDFEPIYSTDGKIKIEPGDILEIRQQINRKLNGSCDIKLVQTDSKDIYIDCDENDSCDIKRKEKIILLTCYDDCTISIPGELGELSVKLLNGDIQMTGLHNPITAKILNGDINIENCTQVRYVKSLNGDIEYVISTDYEGKSEISNLSGDIQLYIPDNFSGIINSGTMNGEIECEINNRVSVKKDNSTGQHKQRIEINDGSVDNVINCSTLSGDIAIESV